MTNHVAVCPNPKCGSPIPADHDYDWCVKCGEYFPEAFKAQIPRLAHRTTARAQQANIQPSAPRTKLATRYTDAYVVAGMINGVGQAIKITGLVLGGLVALVAASKFGAAGLLLGAVVALPAYVLGVLVSAQGQILRATLDTAVNSSPLLSQEEIRQILAV